MERLFASDIRFMAEIDGSFIAVRTYSRERGKSRTGYIERYKIEELLCGKARLAEDSYCSVHYSAWLDGQDVVLTLDWLSEYGGGTLTGYRQRLEVPRNLFDDMLETGNGFQYLYVPRPNSSHIDFSNAGQVIWEIRKHPRIRRAFCKAMRDKFHWQGDCIRLYADFAPHSFYFETTGGWRINGGLILHESEERTPNGKFPACRYEVHT